MEEQVTVLYVMQQSGLTYLENGPGGNHHQESYYSSHRGEVAHEDRVAVGVWECGL